jgi:glutathionylspermidine amidase/synthetase
MSIRPQVEATKLVRFGTILGITDGGVHVYCCDYDTLDPSEKNKEDEDFYNVYNGVTTGYKWQCVELGRRYLLVNHGVVFDNVPMAYDIFRLKHVRRVSDGQMVSMHAHVNGESDVLPTKGSLLIWNPAGEFAHTGHIAVIVNVKCDFVDIVEQNAEDSIWQDGQLYSRRLKATLNDGTGAYTIACTYHDTSILGWMNIEYTLPLS